MTALRQPQNVLPSGGFMAHPNIEQMPRDALAALQLERLRAMLARAYERVPHHRAAMNEVGFKPGDLARLEDLQRLPFTVKGHLREHYPFGLFAVPLERVARLHASSGTTGKPTVVGYTEADIGTWADLMARCFAAAGARPGDVVHNAYGYGLFTGGLGAL
jgi:phenylacetate-CoA ligase